MTTKYPESDVHPLCYVLKAQHEKKGVAPKHKVLTPVPQVENQELKGHVVTLLLPALWFHYKLCINQYTPCMSLYK